mmetsp:Transcript_113710/g.328343  ORF Transcript_113710/g.328343 Transcript_113710/m.328343 type:complete len:283 (+) Transcript_113710:72-920(+)
MACRALPPVLVLLLHAAARRDRLPATALLDESLSPRPGLLGTLLATSATSALVPLAQLAEASQQPLQLGRRHGGLSAASEQLYFPPPIETLGVNGAASGQSTSHRLCVGGLTEYNIFVDESGTRAVLTDLSGCCAPNSASSLLVCTDLETCECGSALRSAPEGYAMLVNMASKNIWQLGLVLARMLLGGEAPPTAELAEGLDSATLYGQEQIREAIRREFSIQATPAFKRLHWRYWGVKRLLEDMLQKDPTKRVTAEAALRRAEVLAIVSGISIPPARQRLV